MRKYFLLNCLFLCTTALFAQGINFDQGTWKEVLAKAKAEDKLVFIDVYTSWCSPCKKMSAEVFPLVQVGEVFNSSFVNYKIDAEKGEGIDIARQFGVRSFPTYLFVTGDGILVYRSGGYNPAPAFLKEANIAIKEKHDPKPLALWDEEYLAGRRDKTFLMDYLKKRAAVKVPNGDILEEAFLVLIKEDLENKELMEAVFAYDPNMTFVPGGKFYQYVIKNYKAVQARIGEKDDYVLGVTNAGIYQYFNTEIIKNNKEEMLTVMLAAQKQLMELMKRDDVDATLKGLTMKYYKGTKNAKKLVPAALDYVNNGLLKLDVPGKIAADKAAYQKMREPYIKGEKDSAQVEGWTSMQRISANQQMVDICYKLRDAAQAIYSIVDNPKMLTKAMEWVKLAEGYFPHFSIEAVYAGLLLKSGRKKEAADMMRKACEDSFIKGGDKEKLLWANLAQIQKGEVPVQLW